jgi:hypothetical protein
LHSDYNICNEAVAHQRSGGFCSCSLSAAAAMATVDEKSKDEWFGLFVFDSIENNIRVHI